MKERRNRFIVALAALASASLVGLAASALACGPPAGGCGGPGGPEGRGFDELGSLERRIQRLDLDDKTRDAAFAIIDGARATTRDLQAAVHTEHEQMHTLLEQDSPNEGAILAQVDRISAATSALRKQELSTMLGVRALLSPAEREQLLPPPRDPNQPRRGGGWPGGRR